MNNINYYLNISNNLKDLLNTKSSRQTLVLYSSQIALLGLGITINVINTKFLGPLNYGVFTFTLGIIAFVSLFFEFGFSSAGSRLLAISKNEKDDRGYIGGLIVVTIGIALLFVITIFFLSFFVDSIFHTHVSNLLRTFSILVCGFPFQYMIQQICQGSNKIKILSAYNITPSIWYLASILIVISHSNLTIYLALLLNLLGLIFAAIFAIYRFRPSFINLKNNLELLFRHTKEYGFYIYIGRLASVSSSQLDKILISYFVNTTWVGFYSLAASITSSMALLSISLSMTLFKDFSHMKQIPKKLIYFNFLWLLCCVLGLEIFGKYIILFLFSDKYLSAATLIFPLAIAGFFQGMYQPYNMFLGAHGKGKWLRNMALIMTCANFFGNIILIPLWGAKGATIAGAIGMMTYYLFGIFYYRKFIGEAH